MARKKACVFITRLIAGGAQKIVVDLLRRLDRTKYDLHLLVGKRPLSPIPEPHDKAAQDKTNQQGTPNDEESRRIHVIHLFPLSEVLISLSEPAVLGRAPAILSVYHPVPL